jgi:hypothetical protein
MRIFILEKPDESAYSSAVSSFQTAIDCNAWYVCDQWVAREMCGAKWGAASGRAARLRARGAGQSERTRPGRRAAELGLRLAYGT